MTSENQKKCPVCASDFMFRITDGMTRRTKRKVPIYACLNCRSLSNPSDYAEDPAQLARDLQWNISVEDRNRRATRSLVQALNQEGVHFSSVLEIGAGTGVFLSELAKVNVKGLGFDINPEAVRYGKDTFDIDLRCEFWNDSTVMERFDLVVSISVLEHLREPRDLLQSICSYASRVGSVAFISVPFVDKEKWKYLLNTDPYIVGTPFFDNDVHVTHFSSEGLRIALLEFGAKEPILINAGLWVGYLVRF